MTGEAQTPNANDLPSGTKVGGRYRVDGLIGRGGMGEVYAATNETTGRRVALKLVRSSDVSAEQKRRFLREAKAATAIAHDNVIDVLDVFEESDGTPVMVMELLEGESLASLLERRGRLTLGECAMLLVPVGRALEAAHHKGIVHRDLKPDNIFLAMRSEGTLVPKVLDFGIAKLLDPEAIVSGTQGGQTKTESILGTPHYMSFEQAMSDKSIDHRTDIWSFGVIVYEMLVGQRPLVFDNLGQMYVMLLQGEVPSIRDAMPDLPEDVATLIDACLKKEREQRLDTLGPLIDALALCDTGDTSIQIASRTSITYSSASSDTQDPVAATQDGARPARSRGVWLLGVGGAAAASVLLMVNTYGLDETFAAPAAALPHGNWAIDATTTTTVAPTTTASSSASAEPLPAASSALPRVVPRPVPPKPRVDAIPVVEPKPETPAPEPKQKGISTASPYGK